MLTYQEERVNSTGNPPTFYAPGTTHLRSQQKSSIYAAYLKGSCESRKRLYIKVQSVVDRQGKHFKPSGKTSTVTLRNLPAASGAKNGCPPGQKRVETVSGHYCADEKNLPAASSAKNDCPPGQKRVEIVSGHYCADEKNLPAASSAKNDCPPGQKRVGTISGHYCADEKNLAAVPLGRDAKVRTDVPQDSERSGFVALKDVDSVWQFPEYPPRPSDEGPGHSAIAVGRDLAGSPSLVVITDRDYGAYGKAAAYAVAHLTGEFPPNNGGGSGIWQFEESRVMENNLFATGQAHSEAYISNGRVRWRVSNDGQTLEVSEVPGGEPTSLTDHAESSSGLPPPWLTLKRVTINPNTRLPAWIEGFYRQ
jgi:hypothetical protein